ncbi:MAG: hypothetical protein ABR530_00325 [Pyrinomonadaceae bacterium]
MKKLTAAAVVLCCLQVLAQGQTVVIKTVVVNDPTVPAKASSPTAAERVLFDRALPAVRKILASECEESVEISAVARGAFLATGGKQSVIFYQFCQTGNGLGHVGLVVIDGDRIASSFIADAGWSADIARVADINQNGLDELVLVYAGGLHQGEGGTGVDLIEFSGGKPSGLGWYQAERFSEEGPTVGWKLTAKPGPTPIYYRQKFLSGHDQRWRRAGNAAVFKLGKPYSKFKAVQ